MAGNLERNLTAPWRAFVDWLAVPAEAEIKRLGITDKDEKNAFAHAYTAALIAHGYLEMPISRGRSADAADLVDVLGRAKEDLPGIFGRQTDFRDYYRDLWNNGIGADIGNYAKSHLYSREELGKLVKDAMDDGAIVSSLTDSRIPAQPSGGYLSWPIPSPPQYQGPNAAPAGSLQDSWLSPTLPGSLTAPSLTNSMFSPTPIANTFPAFGTPNQSSLDSSSPDSWTPVSPPNINSNPAGSSGNSPSPVIRAPQKDRRSAAPDDPASTSAQGAPPATSAFQPDIAGTGGVLGKFNWDSPIMSAAASPSWPPPQGPTGPNLPSEQTAFGDRSANVPGEPRPDVYPRLRRVSSAFPDIAPSDPGPSPERDPPLGIFSDKPMTSWLLPPSVFGLPGKSEASDDEQEQADLQELEANLSRSGNIKDAMALYNARKVSRGWG
jgi:hypothetical protein